jgi:cytochrome b
MKQSRLAGMLRVKGMSVNLREPERQRRRVWDAPVRVIHVLLITCVAGAWLTREAHRIDLHAAFGYSALLLVALRIAWGFLGSTHARFASFAYGPRDVLGYLAAALRGSPRHFTGHNPAGSWAVFGLLGLIGAATLTGVALIGSLYGEGPVPATTAFAEADTLLAWHEYIAWAILALAALHLLGVAWGSWLHRENLPVAMITGKKAVHDATNDAPARRGVAIAIALAALLFSTGYIALWSPHDVERREREEGAARTVLKSGLWHKECGSCHLAYAPSMLPIASWQRMLDEQEKHFGEDLGISAATSARLIEHAKATPAPSWGAWKLASSVPAGQAPLEVSGTPFWKAVHASLPETAFRPPLSAGKHECEACHRDAASGKFHPRMIQLSKGRVAP